MVFGGHRYGAKKKTGEGGVVVENGAALGVDVEEIVEMRAMVRRGVLAKRASMRGAGGV